jgi:hypothetical protein
VSCAYVNLRVPGTFNFSVLSPWQACVVARRNVTYGSGKSNQDLVRVRDRGQGRSLYLSLALTIRIQHFELSPPLTRNPEYVLSYGDVDEVESCPCIRCSRPFIDTSSSEHPSIQLLLVNAVRGLSTTVQTIEFLLYDKLEPRTSTLRFLQDSVFHLHRSPATLGRSSSRTRHVVEKHREQSWATLARLVHILRDSRVEMCKCGTEIYVSLSTYHP